MQRCFPALILIKKLDYYRADLTPSGGDQTQYKNANLKKAQKLSFKVKWNHVGTLKWPWTVYLWLI